jgi:1-acyl-sn-glycerol-3-phosphate acyltransferase
MIWQPVSGCSDRCLTGRADRVGAFTTVVRVVTLVAVLVMGLLLVPIVRGVAARTVALGVLAALGVRMRWQGPLPGPGSLLVANHVSWLDVCALLAVVPVRLVAKCEVRHWPGIGGLAAVLGAIFVDRSRPKSLPATVAEVAGELRAGRSVAVFPEGTTFCGAGRGRFRPAMFQAAVDAGAPVVPVSISYDSTAAAFVGDDTLWSSVRRIAGLRELNVTLVGSPALRPAGGADRRMLARAAQASIGLPLPAPVSGSVSGPIAEPVPVPVGALWLAA